MIENKFIKNNILNALRNDFPEKVILEVMDEYFFMTDSEYSKQIGDLNEIDLFIKTIVDVYKTNEKMVYRGSFGEQIHMSIIHAGLHTGIYFQVECGPNKELHKLLLAAIKTIAPMQIMFVDELDNPRLTNEIYNKVVSVYRKELAPHIMILTKSFYETSGIYESLTLKSNPTIFLSNIDQYLSFMDIDDMVIENVDPDAFAKGEYDYIFNANSMCF